MTICLKQIQACNVRTIYIIISLFMYSLLLIIIYLAFVSLGLPDSVLGSAWPVMQLDLGVPLSYGGILSMIMAGGTIISSLASSWLTRRFSTQLVTACSVLLTALALLGFSVASSFWLLCLLAIPYGLGAGAVDAALNHYVALNYAARHMSWLHCFWGVGVSTSPFIMGFSLSMGWNWSGGYLIVGILQVALSIILFLTLPLWRKVATAQAQACESAENSPAQPNIGLKAALRLKGVRYALLCFFGYCSLEATAGMWASSYLVQMRGLSLTQAASYAGAFFIGLTVGRFFSGFLTTRYKDSQLIMGGIIMMMLGATLIALPLSSAPLAVIGLIIIGLGCAPVYPSLIHAAPVFFGHENAQAIIGLQMAFAYIGATFMPPVFGLIAECFGMQYYPLYLWGLAALMAYMMMRLKEELDHP